MLTARHQQSRYDDSNTAEPIASPDQRAALTDNVKVRLQTQPHDGARKNMLQMFVHVAKHDGVTGLYRGVRYPLPGELAWE